MKRWPTEPVQPRTPRHSDGQHYARQRSEVVVRGGGNNIPHFLVGNSAIAVDLLDC